MDRRGSRLENDIIERTIVERTVDDRSSAIRRRRIPEVKTSEFINNYNPADIAKLAANIVNQQMGVKTETAAEVKTEPKEAIKEDINKDFIKVTQIKENWGETTVSAKIQEDVAEIDDVITNETLGVGVRINMRGKLAISVASVAMLMLLFFTFYNVAMISGLNKNIASVNAQILTEERILTIQESAYAELSATLESIASSLGLKPIDGNNQVYYSPADIKTEGAAAEDTNWFNEFVKWVQNLFS